MAVSSLTYWRNAREERSAPQINPTSISRVLEKFDWSVRRVNVKKCEIMRATSLRPDLLAYGCPSGITGVAEGCPYRDRPCNRRSDREQAEREDERHGNRSAFRHL